MYLHSFIFRFFPETRWSFFSFSFFLRGSTLIQRSVTVIKGKSFPFVSFRLTPQLEKMLKVIALLLCVVASAFAQTSGIRSLFYSIMFVDNKFNYTRSIFFSSCNLIIFCKARGTSLITFTTLGTVSPPWPAQMELTDSWPNGDTATCPPCSLELQLPLSQHGIPPIAASALSSLRADVPRILQIASLLHYKVKVP